MTDALSNTLARLEAAFCPEDVFGRPAAGVPTPIILTTVKSVYRRLAKMVHEDRHPAARKAEAKRAFQLLGSWWDEAKRRLRDGTYGQGFPRVTICSRAVKYAVVGPFRRGDVCNLFRARQGTTEVLLKVARHPKDNDLVDAEAAALRKLHAEDRGKELHRTLPALLDTFRLADGKGPLRGANVLAFRPGLHSVEEIIRAYPNGVDPRDIAWMWKRLLAAVGYAHQVGVVHGALVPSHLLLDLKDHSAYLADWCYSVAPKGKIKAVVESYRGHYSPEVLKKEPALPGDDVYMLAKSIVALLGGDVVTGMVPGTTPRPMLRILRGCILPSPRQRLDAWEAYRLFDEQLTAMFGPRRFRKFVMPAVQQPTG